MNTNPVEVKQFRLRLAPFIIAALCFLMPFAELSCKNPQDNKKIVIGSVSGLQLAFGGKIKPAENEMTKELKANMPQNDIFGRPVANPFQNGLPGGPGSPSEKNIAAQSDFTLAFLGAVIAAGCCFLAGKNGKLIPAIAGAIAFVTALMGRDQFVGSLGKDADFVGSGIAVEFQLGYMLAVLMLLVGAVMAAMQAFRASPTPNYQGYQPPAPPPPGGSGAYVPPPPPAAGAAPAGAYVPPPPPSVPQGWTPPPPSPGAPAPAAYTPPPAAYTQTPAAPMSPGTKKALVGAVVAAAIAAAAYYGWQFLHRYPKNDDVLRFVSEHVHGPAYKVIQVTAKPAIAAPASSGMGRVMAPPPGGVQLDFTATVEASNAVYERIPVEQYMRSQNADPTVFLNLQRMLNSPNSARLRAAAGLTNDIEDFHDKVIVTELAPGGRRFDSTGKINAVRVNGNWQMTLVAGPTPEPNAPRGFKAADFGSLHILSTNDPAQAKQINDIIANATDSLQKLQQARQQMQADDTASSRAAAPRRVNQIAGGGGAAPGVTSGTAISVMLVESVDTTNPKSNYRGITTAPFALADGSTAGRTSFAVVTASGSGANCQIKLASINANGARVTVNSESLPLAAPAPGSSIVKAGKLYVFHQQ